MAYFTDGYINENKPKIVEGQLRCAELNEYLEDLKLEKIIWLSEDGSSIVAKVELDAHNQMVGLVLPIDENNGMPISLTYMARTADEIQRNMQKKKSTLVYLVLAQPLKKGVPPFILQIFGTDNSFKASNVHFRWNHTIKELER